MAGGFLKTSDNKNIYYETFGVGIPIVFIPGFLCTTKFFARNVPELKKHYKIIIMDPRGFGYSSKSGEGMKLSRMAADIKELIDYLQLNDVALIGWSMGGNIVMTYYRLFGSHRLKKIGILDSTLFPYGDGAHNAHNLAGYNLKKFCDQMKNAYKDYRSYCENFANSLFKKPIKGEDKEWIINEAMKCPVNCAFSLYEDFVHENCEEVLPSIDIPILICSASSPRTPRGSEMARYYVSLIKGECYYHEFKEGGHILFYECPEEFNEVIIKFIKGERE